MTKEDIMRMAEASGVEDSLLYEHWRCNLESMTAFANLVAQHEREACAKVCKKHADVYEGLEQNPTAQSAWAACIDISDTIRARGQA